MCFWCQLKCLLFFLFKFGFLSQGKDHESPKVEADRQKTVREKVDGDGAEGGYAAGFEINGCPVVLDNQNYDGATKLC